MEIPRKKKKKKKKAPEKKKRGEKAVKGLWILKGLASQVKKTLKEEMPKGGGEGGWQDRQKRKKIQINWTKKFGRKKTLHPQGVNTRGEKGKG